MFRKLLISTPPFGFASREAIFGLKTAFLTPEPLVAGKCATGQLSYVHIGIRLSSNAPTAIGRLDDKHPSSLGHRRIARRDGDDLGQLFDNAKLLLSVEHAGRRQHLDADVAAVARHV